MTHSLFYNILILLVSSHLPLYENGVIYISPSHRDCEAQHGHCYTLDQLANNDSWTEEDTTLVFLPGIHTLSYKLLVSNSVNLSLLANGSFSVVGPDEDEDLEIQCQQKARFKFVNIGYLQIQGLYFRGCGNNKFISVKQILIDNSTFQGRNNSGAAMEIFQSNATITNSYFISNIVGKCLQIRTALSLMYILSGGAIFVQCQASKVACYLTIIESTFYGNGAEMGGAILSAQVTNVTILRSSFVNNRAVVASTSVKESHCLSENFDNTFGLYNGDYLTNSLTESRHTVHIPLHSTLTETDKRFTSGGVSIFSQSSVEIHSSMFKNNTSIDGGAGVFFIERKTVLTIRSSEFYDNNAVYRFGGIMTVYSLSYVMMDNCTVHNSESQQGGVMDVIESMVTIKNSTFCNNTASITGGVITVDRNSRLSLISSIFSGNKANSSGVLYAINSNVTIADSAFIANTANTIGGGIVISQAVLHMEGNSTLMANTAIVGGAMYLEETIASLYNNATIQANRASENGGGVYLYRSQLKCMQGCALTIADNRAHNFGGGIHTVNSLITIYHDRNSYLRSIINFAENAAQKGGGIYLESDAQLRVEKFGDKFILNKTTEISFGRNSAQYGDAIYVSDETYFDVCSRGTTMAPSSATECFLQVLSPQTTLDHGYKFQSITFSPSNSRVDTSTMIYGGLLDRCTLDAQAEVQTAKKRWVNIDGVTYLKNISNISTTSHISSGPVRLCLCSGDNEPKCSLSSPNLNVVKGERFNLTLVAVDQVNNTVENVMIHSLLGHPESGLGNGQLTQITGSACTTLHFNVYSLHSSEELALYPEGPCRNASRSRMRIRITFQPCTCPVIGFKPKQNESNSGNETMSMTCDCVCDPRMAPFIFGNDCNYQTELLTRRGNFWIAYVQHYNGNSSGFVIHPHCPLDYCYKGKVIHINLNKGNGSDDSQCANNRSGILCGKCRPGLSLSLGSSKCLQCSRAWYKTFSTILIAALLAGIVLVAVLMTLNLTVAIGTLNGIIFYANILGAVSGIISNRIPSMFLSWLNLEVGFDVCLFEGMDTYWKTWLQLAFPSYVILLVLLIIIISEQSMTFSRLIAKRNPVATLATLILLSYTKFLQTTITVLSLARLQYPDGSYRWVWLADGTVEYASGKHIALIVVAIIILTLGIAYTSLLFFWQWILPHQNKWIFKWARSQRLCHFLEPYHAPYNFEHRYWTGLLLFARVILYLVFSLNVSGDPGINLMAITVVVVALITLRAHTGRLYKKKAVDWVEIICYLNVGLFGVIQQYLMKTDTNTASTITEYVSTTIILALLIAVVLYHVRTENCLKCCKHIPNETPHNNDENGLVRYPPETDNSTNSVKPTSSVIERPRPFTSHPIALTRDQEFIDCMKETKHDTNESEDDDAESVTSTESSSPLLKGHNNH